MRVHPCAVVGLLTAISLPCAAAGVRDVALGSFHSCALVEDGSVLCWGRNDSGQLGDGTTVPRSSPGAVPSLGAMVQGIAAGEQHTCALLVDGSVRCWGGNEFGQLGEGTSDPHLLPARVVDLPAAVAQVAAGGHHTCALLVTGQVMCWGWADAHIRSCPPCDLDATYYDRPRTVPGMQSVVEISVGATEDNAVIGRPWALCGRTADGHARCMERFDMESGFDLFLQGVERIATSGRHVCSARASGEVRCSNTQSVVEGLQDPLDLALGGGVSCVVTGSGSVQCWGGLAGDGSNISRTAPVVVSGMTAMFANVRAGSAHRCAISRDRSLWCWGFNDHGQVGDGTLLVQLSPVPVMGLGSDTLAKSPSDMSGLWWNPSESGWGIHLTQRRDIFFAVFYGYDAQGRPTWLTASACRTTATYEFQTTCEAPVYRVHGPRFLGAPFNPSAVEAVVAGSIRLSLPARNSGSLTLTIDTITRSTSIRRQMFADRAQVPTVDYTDLWWNPAESGWGLAVTQQAQVMFLAFYVYDATGRAMWYVAPDCKVVAGGNGCSGTLYKTMGPAFGAGFDPAQVHVTTAGSVNVAFTDANNGRVNYTIEGVQGSKAITRQQF